jgi:putative SOS response-associated peptidase YedK
MCFHYALSAEAQKTANRFNSAFAKAHAYKKTFHASGFNHPLMPVITDVKPEEFSFFQWGLIPFWVKNEVDANEIKTKTLNARADTIFERASFRQAIRSRRCIIPASGFFEWREFKGKKYPYYISLRDEELMGFGGIWEEWTDKTGTGEIIYSFSIITTDANPLMEKIHNTKKRMPFILPPGAEHEWLNPALTQNELAEIIQPLDEDLMQAHTISKLITSKNQNSNVQEVTDKFDYPELQTDENLFSSL